MAQFTCIPPDIIDEVKKIVSEPSSISRDKKLRDLLGDAEQAKQLNMAYEKSLLLKNQKTAIDKFISNFTELGQAQKQELKDRIAQRFLEKKDAIKDKELLAIAQDIWNKKYKLDIPLEEVSKINKLKIKADELKGKMDGTVINSPERIAYGDKIADIANIVDDLKNPRNKMSFAETVRDIIRETGQRFSKESGLLGNASELAKLSLEVLTSAIYKSIQASMDLSYSLRQGFKVLTKDPKVWANNWVEAFKPFKNIGSKEAQNVIANRFKAQLVSHPLYQKAIDSKLAIGVIEDFFPTTLAEKIPLLGNIFKASNEAFTIFSQGSRMGLFEDMVNKASQNGVELTPQLYKDLAKVANSITGRGNLGKLEASSNLINKIFYSGRFIKSQVDTFTMPFNTQLDMFARKEALKSSVHNLSAIGGLMATASLFTDVESDPRSSKFGKMKVPGSRDTWIDLTAGLGSYITLASRVATQKSKSATTGKVSELNSGQYGSTTSFDVVTNWLTGKLAPAPSTAVQFLKGKDYSGKKPTIGSSVLNLATPITAGNALDIFQNEDTATALISTVFDSLGASQIDYTKFK